MNLFSLFVDGAFQPRTNANGTAAYRFDDQTTGDGKNELRFDWRGMSAGQHLIEVNYIGDGLSLEATRLVRVVLSGVSDTDGDGLPDTWETQNGLSPTNSVGINGANGDPDGDGFTNLQEFMAGTNPQDAASLLRITQISTGGTSIAWSSIPGRNYQVLATTNVAAAFQLISGTITAFGSPTSFTNSAPAGAARFYRVRALP